MPGPPPPPRPCLKARIVFNGIIDVADDLPSAAATASTEGVAAKELLKHELRVGKPAEPAAAASTREAAAREATCISHFTHQMHDNENQTAILKTKTVDSL
jgi:hypothetical protein